MACLSRKWTGLLAATALAAVLAQPAAAQDKSASSVIQLPSAGGTVMQEAGTFALSSNTGSANFTLPFPELPTRGKFAPKINLNYNQFAGDTGNGFGIGWSIDVPSVTINDDMGTAIGGFRSNGDFFSRISLAGQRLVFMERDQATGALSYRPQYAEEHIEVTYRPGPFEVDVLGPTGQATSITIPSGFEARYPDGSRRYFSGDPAVAEGVFDQPDAYVTRWPLVLQVNAQRDPVIYSYEKHQARSYLKRVAFAGGQSEYLFDLLDTQATLVSNVTGTRQVNSKLYGKITASFAGSVYNQWCLGYIGRSDQDNSTFAVRAHDDCRAQSTADLQPLIDPNSINVLDQLRVIYRYGNTDGGPLGADTVKLPNINFTYSSWTASDLAARDVVYEAPRMAFAGDLPPGTFEIADLNMDSLVDVVQSGDGSSRILLGEGDLNAAFSQSVPFMLTRTTASGMRTEVVPRLADNRFHFADLFGDSFVDVIEIEQGRIHIYAGNAAGEFNYLGREIPVQGVAPELFSDGQARFQDLNMDGLSDIVTTRLNADGRTEWQIFLNLTRRMPDGDYRVNFGSLSKPLPFTSQDPAMLGRTGNRLVDINGDRLPDFIVIQPAQRGFCIYENQGNIFSQVPGELLFGDPALNDQTCGAGRFTQLEELEPTDRLESMWYVDVNGDGIVDFGAMGSRTDELKVWLGFGDGTFLTNPLRLALNLRVQVGDASRGFRSRIVDLDADGQSEILVFQKPSGEDVKAVVVVDFNRSETQQLTKANLMTTVEFESGRRHDIAYATSTDELLRDKARGEPFTTLHFPVVLAKQMVTSEGIPGLPRNRVQTDEYFYHRPYYDILNRKFLGFSAVEKVTYGDEFAASGEVTQRSSLTNEIYHTVADTISGLHLAGKRKVQRIYQLAADPAMIERARETEQMDPANVLLHSLSSLTRAQSLPEPGTLLSCTSNNWGAEEIGNGAFFIRKVTEERTDFAGPDNQQAMTDDTCLAPTVQTVFSEFDAFNIPAVMTGTVRSLQAPLDIVVPGYVTVTRTEYEAARTALEDLGILISPSRRTVLAGTRLMSEERFTYEPASGRVATRELDVFSSLTEVPEALRQFHALSHTLRKAFKYDAFGNVVEASDALGVTETVHFDEHGNLPLRHARHHGGTSSLDQVTTMTYDGPLKGRIHTQTSPLSMVVTYSYDGLARKILEKAADGAEKHYRYKIGIDGLPSLIMTSSRRYRNAADVPEGESEWIDLLNGYNADGTEIAKVENMAEGGIRVVSYKQYNRNKNRIFQWTPYTLTSFGDLQQIDVRAAFDLGRIPEPSDQIGIKFGYDELNRPVSEAHPSGKQRTLAYRAWGSEIETRYEDMFSGPTVQHQLLIGNDQGFYAVSVGDGAGKNHLMRINRDGFGFMSEIMLPGETVPRSLVYNSAGDLESQSIPGIGTYYYFYDQRGRQVVKARMAEGLPTETVEIKFDFLDRKTAEIANGVEVVSYTYDDPARMTSAPAFARPIDKPIGEPTTIVNRDPNQLFDTTQRFGYDDNGRLVHVEVELGEQTYAESYARTLDSRINRSIDPGKLESIFALGPDQNLRAVSISHPNFGGVEKIIENIAYNAKGQLQRMEYRNAAFTDLAYNPKTLLLEGIRSSFRADGVVQKLQDLQLAFNGNGSLNKITDNIAESSFGHVNRSGQFEYDFKNQLARAERFGETLSFQYTDAGNFLVNDEFEAGMELIPAPGEGAGLVPRSSAAQPYAFDGFGQLKSNPTVKETKFDPYGRLIWARTETQEVFYGYDQTGRRLYKKVVAAGDPQNAASYLFPIQSYSVGPKGAESYTFIGEARLVRLEHATGRWFYYLKDHLESSDYVMNREGLPVEQMLYRSYGTEHKPEELSAAWAPYLDRVSGEMPQEKTHHRFTGKYLDEDTGLYYFGARYYDPKLGRFISPDPLFITDPDKCPTSAIECNLFSYAANNPMTLIDPTGLEVVVAGDETFRKQAEEELQKIDPSARVDYQTGEVSQNWLHNTYLKTVAFFSPDAGHEAGTTLVSRMIESPQTTTVQSASGTAEAWYTDPADASTPTVPHDATVKWDPTFTPALPEWDEASKTTTMRAPDPAIVLGHELIHADHIMGGTIEMSTVSYTGLDGSSQSAVSEEARTVGVGGNIQPDDISENDLRSMMGMDPRAYY